MIAMIATGKLLTGWSDSAQRPLLYFPEPSSKDSVNCHLLLEEDQPLLDIVTGRASHGQGSRFKCLTDAWRKPHVLCFVSFSFERAKSRIGLDDMRT